MRLQLVGYWRSDAHRDLPDPARLVRADWAMDEREDAADYLRRGFVARAWMGRSTCWLCGATLGSLDLTDGDHVWAEGLEHSVLVHAVALPDEFLRHVTTRIACHRDADVDDA